MQVIIIRWCCYKAELIKDSWGGGGVWLIRAMPINKNGTEIWDSSSVKETVVIGLFLIAFSLCEDFFLKEVVLNRNLLTQHITIITLITITFIGNVFSISHWKSSCWWTLFCTPAVPLLYPFCTPSVPRCTLSVPLLYRFCTPSVPLLYPFCTPAVAFLYPCCTPSVPFL